MKEQNRGFRRFGAKGHVTYVAAGADAVKCTSVAPASGPMVARLGITGIYFSVTLPASPTGQTNTVRPVGKDK